MNLLPRAHLFDLKLNQILHRIIAVFAIIFLFILLIVWYTHTAILKFEHHIALFDRNTHSEHYVLSELLFQEQQQLSEDLLKREALANALYTEQRITQEQLHKIFVGLPTDTRVSDIQINNVNGRVSFTGITSNDYSLILYSDWIATHFSIPQITFLVTSQDGSRKFTLEWSLDHD